jgi:hypothetical protein
MEDGGHRKAVPELSVIWASGATVKEAAQRTGIGRPTARYNQDYAARQRNNGRRLRSQPLSTW